MTESAYPRFAYVILGMHRSGTSALAGTLACFGADGPKTPQRPTEDNPKGYFESTPVKVFNDRILASAGSRWDDWTEIAQGWLDGPRAQSFRTEAPQLLSAEFGASPLFVFKDPRICRFWPFWRGVLTDAGITPIPILMLRHPEEVAASLLRRDKLPLALGRLIWLRHVLSAERETRGMPRVVTTYEALLQDRTAFLARLEKVSGFALPARAPATEAKVAEFLDPQLRRFVQDQPGGTGPSADIYHETYQLISGLAAGESKVALSRLDQIGRALSDHPDFLFGVAEPYREAAARLRSAEARADELVASEGGLNARCAETEARLREEAAKRTILQNDVEREATARKEAEAAQAALQGQLDEARRRGDVLAKELAASGAQVRSLQAELADKAALLAPAIEQRDAAVAMRDRSVQQLAAKAAELAQALRDRDSAATVRDAAQRDLAQGKAELAQIRSERDQAAAQRDQAAAQRDTAVRDLAGMARIAQEREATLQRQMREAVTRERQRIQAEFRNSRSWRITAPLRWFSPTRRKPG